MQTHMVFSKRPLPKGMSRTTQHPTATSGLEGAVSPVLLTLVPLLVEDVKRGSYELGTLEPHGVQVLPLPLVSYVALGVSQLSVPQFPRL